MRFLYFISGCTLLFLLLVSLGCDKTTTTVRTPQMVCTKLENDVYHFQYSDGHPLDTGIFTQYLNDWLKDHPEVTVKSLIPQMQVMTDANGVKSSTTFGMLVFAKVDHEVEKQQEDRRKKRAAAQEEEK